MPQLWVVAGPNGAGKSTLTDKYLQGPLEIVNPDVIARELASSDPSGTRVQLADRARSDPSTRGFARQ